MTREYVDCPRARSKMTPCIGRDGHTALADDQACVGCGQSPARLISDLAKRYQPAGAVAVQTDLLPPAQADKLRDLVAAYVG